MAVDALRVHKEQQAAERHAMGARQSERDLVFATRSGAALAAANVRREFRAVRKAAKISENWTPRELRHSFVSLMSSSGRELRAVLTRGAEVMDTIFNQQPPR